MCDAVGRSDSAVVGGIAEGKEEWRKVISPLPSELDILYGIHKAGNRWRGMRNGREIGRAQYRSCLERDLDRASFVIDSDRN